MPELPDLQVFSRNLNKKLKGKKLKKIHVTFPKKLNTSAAKLKKALEGQVLKEVYREGKELRFLFGKDQLLGMHLMLKGRLVWWDAKADKKHRIAELVFDNGSGIILNDYQKKATITLNPDAKTAPDALSPALTPGYLKPLLEKKKTSIKAFLLDQKNVRGIGNAYADEILWEARISPFSVCAAIPGTKIKLLVQKIRSVLKNAEKRILEHDPNLITGEVRHFLKIHNADKEKSPAGAPIESAMLNSRITYYTKEQELFE